MDRSRRSTIAIGLAVSASLPLAAAPAVAAGPPSAPYGELSHSGDIGLHWILDMFFGDTDPTHVEFPAVTCRYDGDDLLREMVIQEPVMFAYVGEGPNTQQVRWRARSAVRRRDVGATRRHVDEQRHGDRQGAG